MLDGTATYELTSCAPGVLSDAGADDLTVVGNGATIRQTCTDASVIAKTQATGTLTLNSILLQGGPNSGASIAGAGVSSAGHLVLSGVWVSGVSAGAGGAVISIVNGPSVYDAELINTTVVGNFGTGLKNFGIGGGVRVVNSTISNNTGSGIGMIDGSPVLVDGSTISANGNNGVSTTGQGTSELVVTGSTITNNASTGVNCGACGIVSVVGSTVTGNGNGAGTPGGGVAMTTDQDGTGDAAALTINDSVVSNNRATHDGGGVSISSIEAHSSAVSVLTTISGSTVNGNHANCGSCDGGGVSAMIGSLMISDSTINGNTADADGGGINQDRAAADEIAATTFFAIADSTVSSNRSVETGGGIAANATTLLVARSQLDSNVAGTSGGGMSLGGITVGSVDSGDITVVESSLIGNRAATNGGAIVIGQPAGSSANITNTTMHRNSAGSNGGGVYAGDTEPVTIRHSTLTENSAANGANVAVTRGVLGASILADPLGGGTNCAAVRERATTFTSTGYSWTDDESCPVSTGDTTEAGTDPALGAPALNEGATLSRLPADTSTLAGLVPVSACLSATDQRGVSRPKGTNCEPGAVEVKENGVASTIQGTGTHETIVGTPGPNRIFGHWGNDWLVGMGGDDLIDGGAGRDVLYGGPGRDILRGGTGVDVLFGGPGDTLRGGVGLDYCWFPGWTYALDC